MIHQSAMLSIRNFFIKQVDRVKTLSTEEKTLSNLKQTTGTSFPGSDYHPFDRKNWMQYLDPNNLVINRIVWPGTHNSATNEIGIPLITRPFAECQSLSIYQQLCLGTRVLDIRVQENRQVCHGIVPTYSIDVVLKDVKRFLSETKSEIIILEIRTEYGHKDPPEFEDYLIKELGEYLIHQDDQVFERKVSEVLPKRVICVWKPRDRPETTTKGRDRGRVRGRGSPLWSSGYLKDDWIDTDLPYTKFESNLKYLMEQPSVKSRKYFYRVENTLTPQVNSPGLGVRFVSNRICGFGRVFVAECVKRGCADRFQIFSTDFIDEDFVDTCAGFTYARSVGIA